MGPSMLFGVGSTTAPIAHRHGNWPGLLVKPRADYTRSGGSVNLGAEGGAVRASALWAPDDGRHHSATLRVQAGDTRASLGTSAGRRQRQTLNPMAKLPAHGLTASRFKLGC